MCLYKARVCVCWLWALFYPRVTSGPLLQPHKSLLLVLTCRVSLCTAFLVQSKAPLLSRQGVPCHSTWQFGLTSRTRKGV